MNKLDEEEREILETFESGNVQRAQGAERTQARHQSYADALFKMDARINIRLSARDLRGLQKKH